jgi:hypothetical protein
MDEKPPKPITWEIDVAVLCTLGVLAVIYLIVASSP